MNPDHAALSPSKRDRTSRCPASARYKDNPGPSGPAAIDGTHSHTLLERCIKDNLANPLDYIGGALEDHEGPFIVDADRAQRVRVAIEYVKARQLQLSGSGVIWAETRIDPGRLTGRPDQAGTFDIGIIGGNCFELIDYKDGMHPVPAENNKQLEQYAAGVLAEYPQRPYPFAEMKLTIIQPKMTTKGADPISSWSTTVEDIMNRVVPALQREGSACDDPNAPMIPGEVQCRYCPAKGFCPEFAKFSLTAAGIAFPSVAAAESPVDVVQQAANRDPVSMTPEQIVQILEAAPVLNGLIAAVQEEALRRLNANGNAFPGKLKLVAGKGARKWALPDEETAKVLAKMGVPKATIFPVGFISPAQVEKAVWDKKGEKTSLTPKQREKLKAEYVSYVAGRPTVALWSDERPALVTDASALFTPVTEVVSPVPEIPEWLRLS